jgi:hypothetical protein
MVRTAIFWVFKMKNKEQIEQELTLTYCQMVDLSNFKKQTAEELAIKAKVLTWVIEK